METIVINVATAEVEIFATNEKAEEFCKKNELKVCKTNEDLDSAVASSVIVIPCELVDDEEQTELSIYPNSNQSIFSGVAEYADDLLNSDLIELPNVPIKYTHVL